MSTESEINGVMLSIELDEALRELPDSMQDGYVHRCRELARAIRALPARADEGDASSGSTGE